MVIVVHRNVLPYGCLAASPQRVSDRPQYNIVTSTARFDNDRSCLALIVQNDRLGALAIC